MCSSPFQMKRTGKTCMQMDLVFNIAFFKWSDTSQVMHSFYIALGMFHISQ